MNEQPKPLPSQPAPKSEPDTDEYNIDELQDADSDEDEAVFDPNVFTVHEKIDDPDVQLYSTLKLHELIHEGSIDLNPPYQRDVVWTDAKQIALISSIFSGYYVPAIVFSIHIDDDGEEVRICVDGKQRLTSIQKFFDGQIPCKDTKSKKLFWYTMSNGVKNSRNALDEGNKQLFSGKRITCHEYRNLTAQKERDMFQRVQLGVTLSAAEKMQAISSPWASWLTEVQAKHILVEGGLTHVLRWDTSRGRDFQNLAYMVYCCDGLPENDYVPTAQKMDKWLSRVDGPTEQFKADIENLLREYWHIATDPELNIGLFNIASRLAPVEFIYVGVLLFVLRKRPIRDRAAAITHLRRNIRAEFKDIRLNSVVCKALWTIVRELENAPSTTNFRSNGENGKGKKRKHAEEEDEYRPSPISTLGKAAKTRSGKQTKKG